MRIALVTDGIFPFEIGGMQKYAFYLAQQFLKKGIDLTVYHCICDREVPPDIHQELATSLAVPKDATFSSKCFKFPRLTFPLFGHYIIESYLYSKQVYNELIREEAFDYIYVQGFAGWYTLLNKNDLPKIGVNFHGFEMFQPAMSMKSQLEKYIFRKPVRSNLNRADSIFSYGGQIREILLDLGYSEEKIQLQYGGVERSLILSEEDIKAVQSPINFLFIARNERRKGYKELREALEPILENFDFTFSFIGQIDDVDQLQSDKVHYYGQVEDSKTYFEIIDRHDVLVVPSISEGLPTVILEAMARGLTVIATNVGAIADIVTEKTGFLVEPKNIAQLNAILIKVMGMLPEDLEVYQKNALSFISENLDWDRISDELIEFIKKEIEYEPPEPSVAIS